MIRKRTKQKQSSSGGGGGGGSSGSGSSGRSGRQRSQHAIRRRRSSQTAASERVRQLAAHPAAHPEQSAPAREAVRIEGGRTILPPPCPASSASMAEHSTDGHSSNSSSNTSEMGETKLTSVGSSAMVSSAFGIVCVSRVVAGDACFACRCELKMCRECPAASTASRPQSVAGTGRRQGQRSASVTPMRAASSEQRAALLLPAGSALTPALAPRRIVHGTEPCGGEPAPPATSQRRSREDEDEQQPAAAAQQ
jgi:hypothetical protein